MKKIIFTMLLVGIILPVSAQIKGKVTDIYNNPVKNAKVAIYSLPDSVQIAGTTANERGEFIFPNYHSVNKLIKISYTGYQLTMFRALPEQRVKLRDELTLPENLALKRPSNLLTGKKEDMIIARTDLF
ncbi:carboxypeptidase-like regulatory domain-containing protein [Lascolabacillus sp.]|uniref:carboxypeptidase-like regulatory domain-containing protein n=1 Tax=Lascolabacillus sp. TaxID=1924068 RepID=UPI002584FA5D|nr:carboxypeptidase-like regulatory domain-containing protein [Lascolabacillus sp.]MDD2606506.1 carboxypeptidase-like regulatory domain-containing protein [Lascolabacillus sp.]